MLLALVASTVTARAQLPGSKEIEMNKLAILEQKTDAEIALAIHYLDPEFAVKRAVGDTATILGISVTFLTFLAGALTS